MRRKENKPSIINPKENPNPRLSPLLPIPPRRAIRPNLQRPILPQLLLPLRTRSRLRLLRRRRLHLSRLPTTRNKLLRLPPRSKLFILRPLHILNLRRSFAPVFVYAWDSPDGYAVEFVAGGVCACGGLAGYEVGGIFVGEEGFVCFI
jgi:hypothetical protein